MPAGFAAQNKQKVQNANANATANAKNAFLCLLWQRLSFLVRAVTQALAMMMVD